MIAPLLLMILAHLISDFMLQSNRMRDGKIGKLENQKHSKYCYQILHAFIHAITTYILIGDWSNFIIPTIIFTTHFAIDYLKCRLKGDGFNYFILDQIAHLVVILIVYWYFFSDRFVDLSLFTDIFTNKQILITTIAYVLILKPTSIALGIFFKRWDITQEAEGLKGAGCWIGYIERVLTLTLIITNNIEAVGFLLAAKSIFRFGELKNSNEIKITEYVLIGTLASFTITVIIGLIVKYLF